MTAAVAPTAGDSPTVTLKRFAAGGLSCMISSALLNFNDVIKVRLQTEQQLSRSVAAQRKYQGYFHAGRVIAAEEGAATLFLRGITASMLREVVYSSVRLGAYEPVKQALAPGATGDIGLTKKIIAGMVSGAAGAAIANPTDLIKIRFQAQAQVPYRSTFHAFASIWRAEGIAGLYKGVLPTTIRASLLTSAQMASYDHTKHKLRQSGYFVTDGFSVHFTAAIVSGLVTAAVTSPVDVVKTRVMSELARGSLFTGPLDCFLKSLRAEGVGVLYKGFIPNYMRLGPHFVISLPLMEMLRHALGIGYV